jgi:hypothetical protein
MAILLITLAAVQGAYAGPKMRRKRAPSQQRGPIKTVRRLKSRC